VVWAVALTLLTPIAIVSALLLAGYQRYAHIVEGRLHGERGAGPSRLYSRPFVLRRGQALAADAFVRRLNALGYEEKPGGRLYKFKMVDQ